MFRIKLHCQGAPPFGAASKSQCWHKSLDFGRQRFGRLREVLQVRCAAACQWQNLTQPGRPSCSAECGAASRRKCGMVVRDL